MDASNLEMHHFFPTGIMSSVNEELADKMLPVVTSYLNDKNYSHNLGYKTTFGVCKLEQYAEFKYFNDYICKLGSSFLHRQGYKYDSSKFSVELFANEMHYGESHWPHTHPSSILSGVIFLQNSDGASPIVFADPRPFRKFTSMELSHPTEFNQVEYSFEIKKGLILIWESWLEHYVPKNLNHDSGRISLIFNLSRNLG